MQGRGKYLPKFLIGSKDWIPVKTGKGYFFIFSHIFPVTFSGIVVLFICEVEDDYRKAIFV